MSGVQRSLSEQQDHSAALFETDVSRSYDEILIVTMCNPTERLNGTGSDDHSLGLEGAASDRCADVFVVMHYICEALHVIHAEVGLFPKCPRCGRRDYKVDFDLTRRAKRF